MRHFKLTMAYDGTDFHGWQMQAGKPTIQGEIVNVLERVTREKIFLHGAGRTDAGVHALGQVASFKTQSALSAAEQAGCPPANTSGPGAASGVRAGGTGRRRLQRSARPLLTGARGAYATWR